MLNNLKLLIKFPTRSRPEKFFIRLDEYYFMLRSENFEFIVSCDNDDETMNNDEVKGRLDSYPNLRYFFSENASKVSAINNNMEGVEFDILLLASDDMQPIQAGYDVIIKEKMLENFPDMDGVLWFNDGFQGEKLNTLSIIGKKYYDRFGYIYNPEYQSLYCDTEFTAASLMNRKVKYFDMELIKHVQYSNVNENPDDLYIRNNKLEKIDYETYQRRRLTGFKDEKCNII